MAGVVDAADVIKRLPKADGWFVPIVTFSTYVIVKIVISIDFVCKTKTGDNNAIHESLG